MSNTMAIVYGVAVIMLIAGSILFGILRDRRNERIRAWEQHQADMRKFDADMAVAMMGDDPNPLTPATNISCVVTNVEPCNRGYKVGDKIIVPHPLGGYETVKIDFVTPDPADPVNGAIWYQAGKRTIHETEIVAKVTP